MHRLLDGTEKCWVNMLCVCACVCVSGAVGGLMETFIYSSLFEGATSAWEGYSHQIHMALFNTLHTHTHKHTFQCTLHCVIPEELSLHGDCPGWKNKPTETPEESPSSIFSWALAYLWATGKWIYCKINHTRTLYLMCLCLQNEVVKHLLVV